MLFLICNVCPFEVKFDSQIRHSARYVLDLFEDDFVIDLYLPY